MRVWLLLLLLTLTHVRILQQDGWHDHSLTVRDGRIQLGPPQGPATAWVVPGFIDAHVHLGLVDPEQVAKGGVTTVRDLGWDPTAIQKMQRTLKRPSVLIAGPILCAPGGYPQRAGWCPPTTALPVTKPGNIPLYDVVKVALAGPGPTLPLDLLRSIVKQAHEAGKQVTAHVSTRPELEKAIEAHVDELAHFMFDDTVVPDALLQQMVRQGMRVCPTLHIRPSAARLDNLRRFVKAGGTVIYGTDLGNYGPRPGIDGEELRLMAEAGMTPLQIIGSATWGSARALGLKDRGRLETGLRADFLVLDADPLQDLQVLTRPRNVYTGGQDLGGR